MPFGSLLLVSVVSSPSGASPDVVAAAAAGRKWRLRRDKRNRSCGDDMDDVWTAIISTFLLLVVVVTSRGDNGNATQELLR